MARNNKPPGKTSQIEVRRRIEKIADELDNGHKRADILEKYQRKFKVSVNMMDRYLPLARKIVESRQQERQLAIQRERAEVLGAMKDKIAAEVEIDAFLSTVMKGEMTEEELHWHPIEKKFVKIPVPVKMNTRLKAAALLYARFGSLNSEKADVIINNKVQVFKIGSQTIEF